MDDSSERTTLTFSAQPFDLAFHAASDVVAVGLVDGRLQLLRYSAPEAGGGGGGGGGAAAAAAWRSCCICWPYLHHLYSNQAGDR